MRSREIRFVGGYRDPLQFLDVIELKQTLLFTTLCDADENPPRFHRLVNLI